MECDNINARLTALESDSKNKLDNLEIKIEGRLNLFDEKITRIEDKIDTKFDLLMITIQQNRRH